MSYRDFAKAAVPIKHPTLPPQLKPKALEWRVGAKFKRPLDHCRGGEILTISRIDDYAVWALEDNLWSHKNNLELVG